MSRVLACVDLSEANENLLVCACTLAGPAGEIVILHVAFDVPIMIGDEASGRAEVAGELRQEHRDVQSLAVPLRARGFSVTPLMVQGVVHERILEHAERLPADYIVLGSRAHWAVHDLLVASVLKGVIRGARVPVVVAPATRTP